MSPTHRADPRAVVLLGLLLTVGVCLAGTRPLLLAFPLLLLGLVWTRTAVSLWKLARAAFVVGLVTMLANGFLIPGERLGPEALGWLRPSQAGIDVGWRQTLRLTNLILISSWVVHHVDAMDFLASLEWTVRGLPALKRWVHQIVLPIALALRMMGTLRKEGERILQVEKLRTHHKVRFRSIRSILPAWILGVVHRGDDLATAMEIRGYHPEKGRLYLRRFQFGVSGLDHGDGGARGTSAFGIFCLMTRYRLDVAYDGKDFSGWQVQPGQRTVQGELAKMVATLGEGDIPTGAGRTDTGVHAFGNAAHVDLERSWDLPELSRALQSLAPPDIQLQSVQPVSDTFHARYDATRRVYAYALGKESDLFRRRWRWEGGLSRIESGSTSSVCPSGGRSMVGEFRGNRKKQNPPFAI